MYSNNKVKVGVMQPYFLPYIGYFQLIDAVDKFVLYDNIEYTKKGWINRNYILVNGEAQLITLSLKKDSDFLYVNQRTLSQSWSLDRIKILNKVANSYRKAPHYDKVMPIVQQILNYEDANLFNFIHHSLKEICSFLDITTEILVSSSLGIKETLKGQDKVISICENCSADIYYNSIGGKELYDKEIFSNKNIDLFFIESIGFEYKQFKNKFVSNLSIVDILMFNNKEIVKGWLKNYKLL